MSHQTRPGVPLLVSVPPRPPAPPRHRLLRRALQALAASAKSVSGTPNETALAAAEDFVRRFRTRPRDPGRDVLPLSPAGLRLVRSTVLHCLPLARHPVTVSWTDMALAAMSSLVAASEHAGVRLDTATVLSERNINRFLHSTRADLGPDSRRVYSRFLELLAIASGLRTAGGRTHPPYIESDHWGPYTRREEADLLSWAAGLNPPPFRARITALVAAGAGCGASMKDVIRLRGSDVVHDDHGTHATLTGGARPPRTVTCRSAWEDVLRAAAEAAGPNLLVAPDRTSTGTSTLVNTLNRANAHHPPSKFNIERLRVTWLTRHVEAGTPLTVLMAAAGLATTYSLERCLVYAAHDPDPRRRLRDAP